MDATAFKPPSSALFIDNTDPNPKTKVHEFPFNINSLNWTYSMNTQSFDTIGGRVTQLLSVRASTMELQGEAGSRENLLNLYKTFKTLQDRQNQTKVSATFNVPSRGLSFRVWLEQMNIAWDYTTVTYPYTILLEIEQEISSTTSLNDTAVQTALNSIAKGIGFSPGYLGLSTSDVNFMYTDIKAYSNNPNTW